jgi:hypothetical protein
MLVNKNIVSDIKTIIDNAKSSAIKAVDNTRTVMYWQIGQRIFEEEQQGKNRAKYCKYLMEFLAQELQQDYGTGFSKRYLELFRVNLIFWGLA